jgi:Ca2+-binding EF-hand superfamily protein
MAPRRSKKSESIEIRLTLEDKQALMAQAASQGRSASDIVRDSIAGDPRKRQASTRVRQSWARAGALLVVPLAVLAVAYAIASPASADGDYRKAFQSSLKRLDRDHNGMIDRQEFAGQTFLVLTPKASGSGSFSAVIHSPPNPLTSSPELRGDFAAQDRDGDGRITLAEYVSYRRELAHRKFGTLDANSDGALSRAEFSQELGVPAGEPGRKLFDSRDANHDGSLSEQELDR